MVEHPAGIPGVSILMRSLALCVGPVVAHSLSILGFCTWGFALELDKVPAQKMMRSPAHLGSLLLVKLIIRWDFQTEVKYRWHGFVLEVTAFLSEEEWFWGLEVKNWKTETYTFEDFLCLILISFHNMWQYMTSWVLYFYTPYPRFKPVQSQDEEVRADGVVLPLSPPCSSPRSALSPPSTTDSPVMLREGVPRVFYAFSKYCSLLTWVEEWGNKMITI